MSQDAMEQRAGSVSGSGNSTSHGVGSNAAGSGAGINASSNGHRLMILGSMDEFVELTKLARRRGYTTYVVDGYPDGPAKQHADASYDIDVRNTQALVELIHELEVDGVVSSFSDILFECLCKLTHAAGLYSYCSLEGMEKLRDKRLMGQMFERLDIPTPHRAQLHVDSIDEDLARSQLRFPCVMKPVNGYGSYGIFVVQSAEELKAHFTETAQVGKDSSTVLLEEYDQGHEINMISWVADSVVHPVSLADREKCPLVEGGVPDVVRIVYPSRFTHEAAGPAVDILQRVANDCGLTDGPLSMQFFWHPDTQTLNVCEVAGRILGYEHENVETGAGLSLEELLLDLTYNRQHALGRIRQHSLENFQGISFVANIHARPGSAGSTVADLSAARSWMARPDVLPASTLHYAEGEAVGHGKGAKPYLARLFCHTQTRAEADRLTREIFSSFSVKDSAGAELAASQWLPCLDAVQTEGSQPLTVSVVIPCYFSGKTIAKVVGMTRDVLLDLGYNYEFVLVNDGSTDNTFEEIRRLAQQDSRIKGIDLIRNFGQHGAIMAGLAQSTGELSLLMDDDMQTHPSQIPQLLDKIYEGYDVVFADYGQRGIQESLFRRLGSHFAEWTSRVLTGQPKDVYASSFFVMRDYVREHMLSYTGPYPYVEGLVFRTTTSITSTPVTHYERELGKSGYTLRALVRLWSSIMGLSVGPLRLAAFVGMALGVIGVVWALVIVIQKLCGVVTLSGWSSIMATLLICFGAVLVFLGVIGEYLGRLSLTVSGSPQYEVRSALNCPGGIDQTQRFVRPQKTHGAQQPRHPGQDQQPGQERPPHGHH